MGALIDPVQHARITAMVGANTEGQTHHAPIPIPPIGCFYPPTLITGLSPAAPLMQEEIFGPVLVSTTFRTPGEAVEIANNTRYGLAASLWTENVNLALDVAPKLAAGVVWVNATNLFDASAPFGGVRESGFGREGGWEGLSAYLKPALKHAPIKPIAPVPAPARPEAAGLDRTAKLYIGGKQARPDGGYSHAVWSRRGALLGHVGIGSRKDIRNAVEAARGAGAWAKATAHNRAQVLYYIAENLSARSAEFAGRLRDLTGAPKSRAEAEVEASVARLFTYAAWADKLEGRVKSVPIRGVAMAMREPLGVIGALAPDDAPLLGTLSLVAPAIAMGNRVIVVPSTAYPLAATDLYQVLETSDLPGGVVNIITGDAQELGQTLAAHADVDALWSFAGGVDQAALERAAGGNLKRTWINTHAPDWMGPEAEGRAFLDQATEIKTIWLPYGE
jgi:aldehyde dehydrogenase (NAD+)